jgi:protein phosphatase
VRRRLGGVDLASATARERLLAALVELSTQLRQESQDQPGLEGMGATVVLALIREGQALISHLGDSRAYLVRQQKLEPLTRDHSLVQLLLDCGEITAAEAAHHPARGQLTRYVGMKGEALPDVRSLKLCAGDRLLLCSDGLTGMLGADEILAILDQEPVPQAACQRLVTAANAAGGQDNITALAVSISGGRA